MTDKDILMEFMRESAERIKENMIRNKQVATGATLKSITYQTKEMFDGLSGQVLGADYIGALEYGRGPTRSGGAGGETLVEKIKKWIRAKGLDLNPYAVAKKIHQEGTVLHRLGTVSGTLSKAFEEQRLINLLTKNYMRTITTQLMSHVKSNN